MAVNGRFLFVRLLLFLGSILIIGLINQTDARADAGTFLVGKLLDKAKQDATDMLDQGRDAAFAIESQTNADVTDRLNQVQMIGDETLSKLSALENSTFSDANELTSRINNILNVQQGQLKILETKFMKDLSDAIRHVQCTADIILQEQLKNALGRVGVLLGTNEITITPPKLYGGEHATCRVFWSCPVTKTFSIRDPFTATYGEIKQYLEDRLSAIRKDTPVQSVVGTYALIGDFAKRTTCFTEANNETYEHEFVKYSKLVRQWNNVLNYGE